MAGERSVAGNRPGKQVNNNNNNNKQEEVAQVRFSHQGNARAEGRKTAAGTCGAVRGGTRALTRPWSAAGRGGRGGRVVVLVREPPAPPAPQPGSHHGEQRAHFLFGDVTGQHGGWRGHASEQIYR